MEEKKGKKKKKLSLRSNRDILLQVGIRTNSFPRTVLSVGEIGKVAAA